MRLTNPLVEIWLLLMGLLIATIGGSFLLTGILGTVFSLGIAVSKSAFIYWRYMHLRDEASLSRVAALGAFAWLSILLIFVVTEYVTRSA